jgi:endo-1,3-1,4-beta-glycanase ExoK
MKLLSPKAHPLRQLSIFFFTSSLLLIGSNSPPSAADDVTQEGWRVEIEEGKSTRSTLTINNRCSAAHLFRIKSSAKFLRFEQPTDSVQIQAKSNKQIGLRFDATGLKIKVYRSKVIVECLDCKKEPGCNQDRDELPVEMIVVKANKIVAPGPSGSIIGRVVDPRNNPITGVEVRTPGQPVVLTNGKGEFDIRGLAATERLAVSFSAPGFIDSTRIYKVGVSSRITGNVVVIWPRATPASLDATRGGKLTFPGGTVSLPPNALIDESGRQLRGNVRVSFSALDVSDRRQIRSVPGDFTARMRNKTIRQLETFGVFEVLVEDSNRRRANLAPGKTAAVELFIPPALRRTAPNRVGLFSFDRSNGLWIEEGILRRIPGRNAYIGPVRSISTSWNADDPINTTCIKLQILDEDNQPVPAGIRVEAEGVDYSGLSPTGYTQSDGTVCLSVKKCPASVRVKAYDPNNAAVSSCPVTISTPCNLANASNCGNPSLCPLQPQQIVLPGGTLYHDLNSDDPTNWHEADEWTNYDATATNPLSPYNVWWLDDNVIFWGDGLLRLRLEDTLTPAGKNVDYTSGEYRTNATYGYGTYEVCMKPAKGSGLMTSFFTYTNTTENPPSPQHDEIDIEFRGMNTQVMWTNFFFNGDDTNHEVQIPLGFDAADDFHRYKFVWAANKIEWYVDGILKRTAVDLGSDPLPIYPGKIMVNLWSGRPTATWLYLNAQYTPQNTPIYAYYDWIRYKP